MKTLEWKYDRERKIHYAGHYRIEKNDFIGIQYIVKFYLTCSELGRPLTLATAKRIAQLHYNKKLI